MPTREWIKMQSHIDSLETEISHVARTNELLNQELDKVNGHLERLTSDEGEGWRKEYEFLVQQIDVMHRQLQFAYSQMGRDPQQRYQHQQGLHSSDGEADGQPETAMQLRQEIKELSSSLKSWKTAFHTTEENYRRKCEGERALKQALQQREAQLSSLVERLSGYDSGSQRSIASHQDLLRLSTGLEELQSKNYLTSDASTPEEHSLDSEKADSGSHGEDRMPGVFPEGETQPSALSTAGDTDRLSSSILSWTTLLATYMLS
ncbi:hypothetical protein BGZ98_010311 [Dissophora globulifera]|nr:hypothetical protein BGZ98_010311 [Dissophora globulifera]